MVHAAFPDSRADAYQITSKGQLALGREQVTSALQQTGINLPTSDD